MTFHVLIHVSLKPDVADVQGAAIQQSLASHDYPVKTVRAGKFFEVILEAADRAAAEALAQKLATEVFSNPVIETAKVAISERA